MTGKLDMVLTHYWFDEILAGRKTCEYRRFCPTWIKRIGSLKQGDKIVFRRGYTGVTLTRTVKKVRVIPGWDLPNDVYKFFGCPNETQFFEIQFQ
jgi:ASC-1-like (ASCH) protein